jgi:hypothetical protein
MSTIYSVREDGTTETMKRVRCTNEGTEIQALLEMNLDLIPGDQVNPDDPRRWLMIKKEMPVPDPSTGSDRWSIDFFIVDQDAVPTFVECKRFNDTRSRREIVGQMLEYAANGHYYWTSDIMRGYAEVTASKKGLSLDESLRALHTENEEAVETFFSRIEENLREGQLRIVFFLDESPMELRSVVDFLNRQMERSEVLLVEARQYDLNGQRVVAPMLFGYTEQARQVKRSVTVNTAGSRKKWDRSLFMAEANSRLTAQEAKIIDDLYDKFLDIGFNISFGTGTNTGSFSIKAPDICPRSFLTIWSNGNLALNFGWISGSDIAEKARDRFAELIREKSGMKVHEDYIKKYLSYSMVEWAPQVTNLIEVLKQILSEFRAEDTAARLN